MRTIQSTAWQHLSLLIMRIVIGGLFVYHGLPKVTDINRTMGMFASMGFPGFLGPLVGVVEVVAGIFLIVGILNKWSTIALGVIMLVALVGVQIPGALSQGSVTAGLERDLVLLIAVLISGVFGSGAYSVRTLFASK